MPAPVVVDKSLKDNILDAVDRLLARYGYQKMTIDDVARAAGIGKGTVYLQFRSKEEMALSSIDRLIERLMVRLTGIAASPGTAPDRLRRMLVERVLFRFDNLHQDSQSLDAMLAAIRPALLMRRKGYFDLETRAFAATLSEGMADGGLKPGDPEAIARTLLDATNSLLPYSLSAAELGDRDELVRKAGSIADLLLFGITQPTPVKRRRKT